MACAFAGNYKQLLSLRTILGVGEAGYGPAGVAMVSWLYPIEKRARMLGIWGASQPLGIGAGIALGGLIAAQLGWRYAFGLVALPGLIVAILFFFVKDYKTVALVKTIQQTSAEAVSKMKMRAGDIVKEFLRTSTLVFTYLGFTASIFVTTSIMTWLPTFYHRMGGITEAQASIIIALAVIGQPVGGYLSDLWVKRNPNSRLIYCTITPIISALLLFAAFFLFEGNVQYIVLIIMGIVVTAFVPAAVSVTQEVIHPGLRSMSYAFAVLFQSLLGASLGPIVIGAISDATDLQTALRVLSFFLILSSALFFTGSFFYKRDFNKVEKIAVETAS